jgi:mono/diheme cytochrome c family protein
VLKPILFVSALILSGSMASFQQATPPAGQPTTPPPADIPMPANAAQMVNPVKATPESQAKAKKIYGYDCAMCHGANGDGKGDIADGLKTKPGDLTNPTTLQDKKDGELFYMIKNGKGEMPAEGDRIKSDDVWNLVIYVRTLSKGGAASSGQ